MPTVAIEPKVEEDPDVACGRAADSGHPQVAGLARSRLGGPNEITFDTGG